MVKDYLEKRKAALSADNEKRSTELEELAKRVEALEKINDESENEEELKAAGEELDALKAKKEELEAAIAETQKELDEVNAQLAELDKPSKEEQPQRKLNFMKREERGNNMNREELETRANKFAQTNELRITNAEARATLVSGGKVATPTGVSGINDAFNEVSSIVDLVEVVSCEGMGANKVAYEKSSATAGTQTEGSGVTPSDPEFGFVEIKPTSIEVVSYVSKQVRKQTALNYTDKVEKSAKTGLRKTMAGVITDAIKTSNLLDKTSAIGNVAGGKGKINESTLRKLVLSYGGNANVEGNAWLQLNKTDLIAFGDVRGTNEKKAVYEIIPNATNPNVGQIKEGGIVVNYCINPNCDAFDGTAQPASTAEAKPTMIYGNPKCCELDLFSDYEVSTSEHYKFVERMLTVVGDVEAGAAVTYDKGFVALMLPKASA